MESTQEKLEEVTKILNNKFPTYIFQPSPPDYIDLKLTYYGGSDPKSFKNYLGRKVDDLILTLKSGKINHEITNDYLIVLIDELTKTKKSYELKNINGREFYFQTSALINLYDGESSYFSIEDLQEHFFDEVVQVSQLKYDYTLRFIDGLKEVLQIEAQNIDSESTSSDETDNQSNDSHSNTIERIELNVSLSDIVLLFRLLEENKVFTVKHKTHIFRMIQNSFKGPNKSIYNVGSIKNAFNEPDTKSVKNLEFLLANMKTSLKNI